jgi:hypothetical protein
LASYLFDELLRNNRLKPELAALGSTGLVGQTCSRFAGYFAGYRSGKKISNERAADHNDHKRPEAVEVETHQFNNRKTD